MGGSFSRKNALQLYAMWIRQIGNLDGLICPLRRKTRKDCLLIVKGKQKYLSKTKTARARASNYLTKHRSQ